MQAQTPVKPKRKISTSVMIGAVLAVVVIAVLIIVIVRLLNVPVETRTGGVGTVATIDNIDEIQEKRSKPVEDGYYRTRMNVDWSFDTWNTPSQDAYVANADTNKRTVYFTVALKETDEIVYTSPDIPVGSQLTGFALDKDPGVGEHAAVTTYHLLDDDGNELTTVSVSVTLRILS
jgi:hypothetical protein